MADQEPKNVLQQLLQGVFQQNPQLEGQAQGLFAQFLDPILGRFGINLDFGGIWGLLTGSLFGLGGQQTAETEDGDGNEHTTVLEEDALVSLRSVAAKLDDNTQVTNLIRGIEDGTVNLSERFTTHAERPAADLDGQQSALAAAVSAAFQSGGSNQEVVAGKLAALASQADTITLSGNDEAALATDDSAALYAENAETATEDTATDNRSILETGADVLEAVDQAIRSPDSNTP